MKKIKNLSESSFLKLLFAFIAVCFLIAAVCMPDRGSMLTGLWQILSQPCKITTNYFSVGGFAGTFLNMSLVALAMTLLFHFSKTKVNNVSTLAFLLTLGFCTWGIHILNMWFTMTGVILVNLIKKDKPFANVNAMLFTTGVAPFISDLLLRYPHAETIGFNALGIVLAVVVGIVVGVIVTCGLPHSPNVHKGFNLYSAALPVGMTMFLLNGIFYKVVGVELPGTTGDMAVASAPIVNIFCGALFGLCIVLALLLGCTPKDYWQLLKNRNQVNNVSGTLGNAVMLMNLGVYGLFILGYYNLISAPFNGVTFGLIFCMLCTCNSGSRPTNVWPIMLGYVVASFATGWISSLVGGNFATAINAQAIVIGLCYANGLSPICDKYGWHYGFVAAMIHYCLVTLVPGLHGGFCLYNGGFTAIFVCIIFVPVLEKFCKTKEARLALKAK
ncbi:MAG: DUF1576 domain-containing protein [Oscillospiraceae bacterium]|nr:DUF1576 domain-containing protein [Oscillospiraceae bacterium]